MSSLKENCGVVGAASSNDGVANQIWLALLALQHRGQEANGIFTFDGESFHQRKDVGLVSWSENYNSLKGTMGIGHVRYSTVGKPAGPEIRTNIVALENFAQPFFIDHEKNGIAFSHNGNIVNNLELARELTSKGIFLSSRNDSEVILKTLVDHLKSDKDLAISVKKCMNRLEGSYSITALTGEGEVFAFRDPYGFRPLSLGKSGSLTMIASESVALNVNGISEVSDVAPGELVVLSKHDVWREQIIRGNRRSFCMFEFVYFSRPDSIQCGRDVYSVRIELGRRLAKTYDARADVIVPVPDTARPAAEGISRDTGIRVAEGLIKNRYIGRTFIMPSQQLRDDSVHVKLNPVRSVLKDRRVIVVDDSIVRGTTSKKIINLVKQAGAKEVEMWVTCPPIISPCFYGIDIATHAELIAAVKSIPQIQKTIGADRLCYQTIEGLVEAIGIPRDELCMACLTGEYPTPIAQKVSDQMLTKMPQDRVRYWEMA
jgi:amidophosphoribosyltransferase